MDTNKKQLIIEFLCYFVLGVIVYLNYFFISSNIKVMISVFFIFLVVCLMMFFENLRSRGVWFKYKQFKLNGIINFIGTTLICSSVIFGIKTNPQVAIILPTVIFALYFYKTYKINFGRD